MPDIYVRNYMLTIGSNTGHTLDIFIKYTVDSSYWEYRYEANSYIEYDRILVYGTQEYQQFVYNHSS